MQSRSRRSTKQDECAKKIMSYEMWKVFCVRKLGYIAPHSLLIFLPLGWHEYFLKPKFNFFNILGPIYDKEPFAKSTTISW